MISGKREDLRLSVRKPKLYTQMQTWAETQTWAEI